MKCPSGGAVGYRAREQRISWNGDFVGPGRLVRQQILQHLWDSSDYYCSTGVFSFSGAVRVSLEFYIDLRRISI